MCLLCLKLTQTTSESRHTKACASVWYWNVFLYVTWGAKGSQDHILLNFYQGYNTYKCLSMLYFKKLLIREDSQRATLTSSGMSLSHSHVGAVEDKHSNGVNDVKGLAQGHLGGGMWECFTRELNCSILKAAFRQLYCIIICLFCTMARACKALKLSHPFTVDTLPIGLVHVPCMMNRWWTHDLSRVTCQRQLSMPICIQCVRKWR